MSVDSNAKSITSKFRHSTVRTIHRGHNVRFDIIVCPRMLLVDILHACAHNIAVCNIRIAVQISLIPCEIAVTIGIRFSAGARIEYRTEIYFLAFGVHIIQLTVENRRTVRNDFLSFCT